MLPHLSCFAEPSRVGKHHSLNMRKQVFHITPLLEKHSLPCHRCFIASKEGKVVAPEDEFVPADPALRGASQSFLSMRQTPQGDICLNKSAIAIRVLRSQGNRGF